MSQRLCGGGCVKGLRRHGKSDSTADGGSRGGATVPLSPADRMEFRICSPLNGVGRWWLWAALILIPLGLSGCPSGPPWEEEYHRFLRGESPTITQEGIMKEYGRPNGIRRLKSGDVVWTYWFTRGNPQYPGYECWEYFLRFDTSGVLRAAKQIDCAKDTAPDLEDDQAVQRILKDQPAPSPR